MANIVDPEAVRSVVLRALMRKLGAAGRAHNHLDEGSKLLELGIIDSEDLIEIILDVEAQCGYEFNPQEIDLETGLTLRSLIGAFVTRG